MKAYLLGIATGAALAAGGIELSSLAQAAVVPHSQRVAVSKLVPNSNVVMSAIWQKVDDVMCPVAEAKVDWDAGECSVEEGAIVSFSRGEEDTTVSASFSFAGSFVKGTPE